MSEKSRILELANAEVGYLEKASNNNLDDKIANAGDKNYTKYARDMDNLKVYNGIKQGYAWCNVFIDWLFYKALGQERALQLLIGWSAGCTQDWNWFKSHGQTVTTPQTGDLVFFGDCDHIGIVEKVENGKIYTIEGNTSNKAELIVNGGQVAKKSYDLTSKYIKGYARPKYNEEASNQEPSNEITYSLIKRGSTGNLVRIAQQKLIEKGYRLPKYGVDGSFGSETEEAVKQLQRDVHIEVDGIIGKQTWQALNSVFVKPTPTYPGYYIMKGQVSEDVRKVQARLIELGYSCGNCGADSIFGNGTLEAVKAFQRKNGLAVDGIVGPKTWEKLF